MATSKPRPDRTPSEQSATAAIVSQAITGETPTTVVPASATAGDGPTTDIESIPPERRCPLCWHGQRGIGLAYHTNRQTRYYKCSRSLLEGGGGCGFTWSVQVHKTVREIRHRRVNTQGRPAA